MPGLHHHGPAGIAETEICKAVMRYSTEVARREGRPLNARAAFAILGEAVNDWFGGDQVALARWAGLEGLSPRRER